MSNNSHRGFDAHRIYNSKEDWDWEYITSAKVVVPSQLEYKREYQILKNKQMFPTQDKITNQVIEDLKSRSERGYKKYNTTLNENNKDDYMKHLYEELLDAAQYIKKEISIIPELQKLIEQYPKNEDLGEQIRLIYGKE